MIRISHPQGNIRVMRLALCFFVSALLPSFALGESPSQGSATNVTILTAALPSTLTVNTQLSGLAVVEIEHLGALGANLLYVQLDEGHAPQSAVAILRSAYPHTKFELFEDLQSDDFGVISDLQ